MAERDDVRKGAAPKAGNRPNPADDDRAGDADVPLDAWAELSPPLPRRGQPGLSWSDIADLDDGEQRSQIGNRGGGVGPIEGTGGLLGVDSGLLRVLDVEESERGEDSLGALPLDLSERPEDVYRPGDESEADHLEAPDLSASERPQPAPGGDWLDSMMSVRPGLVQSGAWADEALLSAEIEAANGPSGEVDLGLGEGPLEAASPLDDEVAAHEATSGFKAAQTALEDPNLGEDLYDLDIAELVPPGFDGPQEPDTVAVPIPKVESEDRPGMETPPQALDENPPQAAEDDDWVGGPVLRGLLGPTDPMRELDPFAAAVVDGLGDELAELGGDPFDSMSQSFAPATRGPFAGAAPAFGPDGSRGRASASLGDVELEPLSGLGSLNEDPISEPPWVDNWETDDSIQPGPASASELPSSSSASRLGPTSEVPSPTPEADLPSEPLEPRVVDEASAASLAEAKALIESRSLARRAQLDGYAGQGDSMAVLEVLSDLDDRRVVLVEHAPVDELSIDLSPEVDFKSVLGRLSAEPMDLSGLVDAPVPGPTVAAAAAPALPPPPPLPSVVDLAWSTLNAPPSTLTIAPSPPLDRAALERVGVPLLGSVPVFEEVHLEGEFPPGSLALSERAAPTGPAIVPDLALPDPFDLDCVEHRLLAMLQGEISACSDRRRLSLLLHAYARIAKDVMGDRELAWPALRGAFNNDPAFTINRWSYFADMEAQGEIEGLVAQLVRLADLGGSTGADALYRAGHFTAARLLDRSRAASLWDRASELDPRHAGPLLARYTALLAHLDWEGAERVLGALEANAHGPMLSTLLALERVRLASELQLSPEIVRSRLELAHEHASGGAAVVAAIETFAAQHLDAELLLIGLRGHFDAVTAAYEHGLVTESSAKHEVAETYYKAGWALERLGRKAEALREYHNALQSLPNDPYLLHHAGELARKLGRAEDHRAHLERLAALARDPLEAANTLYQMGLIAQKVLADESMAALDFERAVAAMPTFTPALAALGRQASRQGRWQDVKQRFENEIAPLEESLALDVPEIVRVRSIRALVTRYYRVARLLEVQLSDPDAALQYHKRALALAPDFLPSFLALERLYESAGRHREMAALYLGLVERSGTTGLAATPFLLRAAEVLQTRLGDDRNAGRAYARVLALEPNNASVLADAADVFTRLGGRAARIEIDARRAQIVEEPADRARLLHDAAEVQLIDGDPLAAAAEALPLFKAAYELAPSSPGLMDGLFRVAVRLSRPAELAALQSEQPALVAFEPFLAAQFADYFMVHGRTDDALVTLDRWSRQGGGGVTTTALRVMALERLHQWRPLVDAIEELAARTENLLDRAGLHARCGELLELRLADGEGAAEAYGRALALDPSCRAARDGRMRVEATTHDSLLSIATRSAASGLRAARDAALASDTLEVGAQVERLLQKAKDDRSAVAVQRIAGGASTPDEAVFKAFADAPDRLDRFEDWMARLEGSRRLSERIHALWTRLPHEDDAGRPFLLSTLIASCEEAADEQGLSASCERLSVEDPASLIATLALERQALRRGDQAGAFEHGERLAGLLQTPGLAASVYRRLADVAESSGAGPSRARALLEHAAALAPEDGVAFEQLSRVLEADEDWSELVELHSRRIDGTLNSRGLAGTPDSDAFDVRALYIAKARLLAFRLGRNEDALATLQAFVDLFPLDTSGLLDAGCLAVEASAPERGLEWILRASVSSDPVVATHALIRATRLHSELGQPGNARQRCDELLLRSPDDITGLEISAELFAQVRDWPAVVKTLRRLYDQEKDSGRRAARAHGIGEILSRVKGDARQAAGWFKRAVELAPGHLPSVWRLLDEVDRLPPGAIPVEHITDAVDRGIEATYAQLTQDPFDPEHLRAFALLSLRRGAPDGAYLARCALEYVGLADPAERAFLAQRRERLVVDPSGRLTSQQRAQWLRAKGEECLAGALFESLSLILVDLLAERPPGGATRLSGRSFPRWQADFGQLSRCLGADELEVWQVGQAPTRLAGTYLPSPSLMVGTDVLASPIDAAQAFRLGSLVEGLHAGRLLIDRVGPVAVAQAVSVVLTTIAPSATSRVRGQGPMTPDLRARLVDRAQRLPRRTIATIEVRLAEFSDAAADFTLLGEAISMTRDRAGFLVCCDLGVALDHIRSMAAATFDIRSIRSVVPARDLMTFALSADALELRRTLGVAVTR